MKKRITTIIAVILTILLVGTVVTLFVFNRNKSTSLYVHSSAFLNSEDCKILTTSISEAQSIYNERVSLSETRLAVLNQTIDKLDELEKDLNTYLTISTKSSKAVKISNSYKSLTSKRNSLIEEFEDYINRMNNNIGGDEGAVDNLYNHMFDLTTNYLQSYNECFKQTIDYTFNNVVSSNNIKYPIFSLYYHVVDELLTNVSEHKFRSTYAIDTLNSKIILISNNLKLNDLTGGEFSSEANNFQQLYSKSDIASLLENFEAYYIEEIDETNESNVEKLTIFYLKKIL